VTTALQQTRKPFGQALAELLRESDYTTQTGNVNWRAFARTLEGIHYETLRKAVAGERTATPHIIEEVARALGLRPDYFVEYRLWQAQREFDIREVGFERALENFERWAQGQEAAARRPRRRRS
jgi:plasmid maintenance system antidote protein VapI